ncbi:MAG: class I SAM-dependent methyltransferase [Methanobacteriota archaeon]|nr:MAG: class I SAM-dependent methyltransferase [Euryarchaeota archaeon]
MPPRISFDHVADVYDETRAYAQGVTDLIGEALERVVSKESRLLEVGVGTGRTAHPLTERGFDITGVDISTGMLSKARAKGLRRLLIADATALPFADLAFDHVLSAHLTHLISDWRHALAEIGRVASGLYLSVINERIGCQAEEMQRAYEDLCAEDGFEVRHPGMREREIADIVAPLKTIDIADSTESVPVEKAIGRYRSRCFSDQWSVPDDVHENAMRKLERMYAGVKELDRREKTRLFIWSAGYIRECASEPVRTPE